MLSIRRETAYVRHWAVLFDNDSVRHLPVLGSVLVPKSIFDNPVLFVLDLACRNKCVRLAFGID